MTPKAIETQWKGYRFRSRLEARWAVFFEAMGLAWDYEPEGYDLPNGRYLPDFRIWFHGRGFDPHVGKMACSIWVEIKGGEPTPHEKDLAEDLFWTTRIPVVILSGEIRTVRVSCECSDEFHRNKYGCDYPQATRMSGTCTDSDDQWSALPCWMPRAARGLLSGGTPAGVLSLWRGDCEYSSPTIEDAVKAARSARFEHGEQPVIPPLERRWRSGDLIRFL